jgi:FtsH-binding integral membrane protein
MLYVVAFAPLTLALLLMVYIEKVSVNMLRVITLTIVICISITLTIIMSKFTNASIMNAFLSTSLIFLVMSIFGMKTKIDLTKVGTYLLMALVGVIIVSIINFFIGSSILDTLLSICSVIIFTGLTAYDVQDLQKYGIRAQNGEERSKMVLLGALSLYMNFVNIFIDLLKLFGDKK